MLRLSMPVHRSFFLILGLFLLWQPVPSLRAMMFDDVVTGELITDVTEVAPGDLFRAGVKLRMEDGWHIYGESPADTGLPTEVTWEAPVGIRAGPVNYPPTVAFVFEGIEDLGYEGEVLLWSYFRVPEDFEGDSITIKVEASYLVCKELCIPGSVADSVTLPVGAETIADAAVLAMFEEHPAPPPTDWTVASTETDDESPAAGTRWVTPPLALILVFGFIGGLILNIMPCVLPVIGVKVLSVVKQSGDSPKSILIHGWVFTAGVVTSFWILAAVVVVLQATGQSLGQGFQFQYMPFLIGITSLIFVLGLSLLGVFLIDLGSGGYKKASHLVEKKGLSGAFFNGFLVTALATPCTAPFLGAAMGFAFTQPPLYTFLVFTFVGLGLASPFTLLAHKPQWLRFLPKPGAWMEYFKQAMGFILMGAVVWLLYIVSMSRGGEAVVWTVAFLLFLGLASWVYGTFHGPANTNRAKWMARLAIVALLAIGWHTILEERLKWREAPSPTAVAGAGSASVDGGIEWVSFSYESLEEALATDRPVFMDFTAAWCLSCKVNERTSLEIPETRALIQESGTIAIKGDWTNQNPEIAGFLREFGRAGVPLYLVYGKDRDNPQILPEVLTPQIVGNALRRARESFEES